MNASDSAYPISLSRSIIDERGEFYQPLETEIVGEFKRTWRHWQWFQWDLNSVRMSGLLANEIEKREGDGVVNLRVKVVSSTDYLTAMLLVLPTSLLVTVEGDVIRRGRNDGRGAGNAQ